jgi:hypothetical protein
MRVEPRVARRKFDAEVARLEKELGFLDGIGCWIRRVEFPTIEVVFVPREPLIVHLPVIAKVGAGLGMQVLSMEFRSLGSRAFGVEIGLDDYDARAPSVLFVDPWTGEPLKFEEMARAQLETAGGRWLNVLIQQHPTTKLPFLCVQGTREYHEHPQHDGDDWHLHRRRANVFTLLDTIWRACIVNARPSLSFSQQAMLFWHHPEAS